MSNRADKIEPATASPARQQNFRLARELQRDRRWPEAAYRYRCVLDEDPDSFEAALGLGIALLGLGRWDEAAESLQRAVQRDGNSAEAHAKLASAWYGLMRWQDAAAALERSLMLRPADQQTLLNLGFALSRLDRRAELNVWIEKALVVEPGTAALHGMLAAQFFAFGRLDEAVGAMDRMIALEPMNGPAHAFRAQMKRFVPGDPDLAALEQVAAAAAPAEERCIAGFALGKAYADLGRNAESFEQYAKANRIQRSRIDYDIRRTLSQFEALKAVFTPGLMQAGRGAGDPSERPVFIVGMMRSGTTLVEQILAMHPQIHGGGESPNFQTAGRSVMQSFPQQVLGLGPADLRRLGEAYLRLAETGAGNASRIVDKTLSNDLFVGLIHLALPKARILHVVRDPVDTCLSAFSTNFGAAYPYTFDLAELGQYCRAQRQLMAYWRELLPENVILDVRYEDVVRDVEGETRRMLAFCGLEWDPACLAFDKSDRAVWTASAAQVRRPLYAESVGRWRPAPHILKPLLDGLGTFAAPADHAEERRH
jgi:tetratricopeptide (TPR) repeat protein